MDSESANKVLNLLGLRLLETDQSLCRIGPLGLDELESLGNEVVVPAHADYTDLVCAMVAAKVTVRTPETDTTEGPQGD